jgi:hypothetical protein
MERIYIHVSRIISRCGVVPLVWSCGQLMRSCVIVEGAVCRRPLTPGRPIESPLSPSTARSRRRIRRRHDRQKGSKARPELYRSLVVLQTWSHAADVSRSFSLLLTAAVPMWRFALSNLTPIASLWKLAGQPVRSADSLREHATHPAPVGSLVTSHCELPSLARKDI